MHNDWKINYYKSLQKQVLYLKTDQLHCKRNLGHALEKKNSPFTIYFSIQNQNLGKKVEMFSFVRL